jgi:hypothetical protein
MASIVVSGDTSGAITIAAPAVAGTNTLTLPTNTGTIITTGSSGQSIPKAALPTGSVLQVVNTIYTTQASTSIANTFFDSGLSLSITPLFSTSKILVFVNQATTAGSGGDQENQTVITLLRGSTNLFSGINANNDDFFRIYTSSGNSTISAYVAFTYLDSPATTSSTTYKTQYSAHYSTAAVQKGGTPSFMTLMEIAA